MCEKNLNSGARACAAAQSGETCRNRMCLQHAASIRKSVYVLCRFKFIKLARSNYFDIYN